MMVEAVMVAIIVVANKMKEIKVDEMMVQAVMVVIIVGETKDPLAVVVVVAAVID